uniref:SHNi-TPR domain-containing protein n=1 Tax=Caenorhabditis japonica TaxID=281687 RepID=A0A8R1I1X7_CAEJA
MSPLTETEAETVQKEATPELTLEENETKLAELITTGRRFLKINDFSAASEVLSEATELSDEIYGSGDVRGFEAIKFYGMATLELAKAENQLLASQEKEGGSDGGGNGAEDGENADAEGKEENGDGDMNNGDDDENGSKKDDDDEDGEPEEEEDSMKLAWQLLEIARCLACRKVDELEAENADATTVEKWKLEKAEVFVLTGEHGIADGSYVTAQEDLTNALQIQTELLPPTSRILAQTNLLIGNACSQDARYDEAVKFYEQAKETLNSKLDELKSQLADESIDQLTRGEIESEVKELDEMLPLVEATIADAVNSAAQTEEVKKALKEQFAGLTKLFSALPEKDETTVEANDISKLIRRPNKRQAESDGNAEEMGSKKANNEASSSAQN